MALNAVLVDRARVLVKEDARGRRVEGTTVYEPVPGAWFKCRLFLGRDPLSTDEWKGRRRAVRSPTLMFGVKDLEGNKLDIGIDSRIEVESAELGTNVWRVTTEPEPMRKRRSVLGFQATIERVEARDRNRSVPSG